MYIQRPKAQGPTRGLGKRHKGPLPTVKVLYAFFETMGGRIQVTFIEIKRVFDLLLVGFSITSLPPAITVYIPI